MNTKEHIENIQCDVLVVGGGNAGVESATAAARLKAKTILLTQKLDDIGCLPCNASIGGSGKSQILKEMDVFGASMGRSADQSSIHRSILNQAKGHASWSLRIQVDRFLYRKNIYKSLGQLPNLFLKEGRATKIKVESGNAKYLYGQDNLGHRFIITFHTIIVTTGTFLSSSIAVGGENAVQNRGRIDDPAFTTPEDLGLESNHIIKFSTGTSCRINTQSIDFSVMEKISPTYQDTARFSLFVPKCHTNVEMIDNYIVRTNEKINDLLLNHLYIPKTIHPRYCISLNDKVAKFPDRYHQIFVQPEGYKGAITYLSSPVVGTVDFQQKVLAMLPGFNKLQIARYGYQISYAAFDPKYCLNANYSSKHIPNLFLAGQINGTTGYEEAACQGLLSGINAVLHMRNQEPFVLTRDSYMGVLSNDLHKGITEPYRILPSFCENRLGNRGDNAYIRLGQAALDLNILNADEEKVLKENICLSRKVYRFLEKQKINSYPEALVEGSVSSENYTLKEASGRYRVEINSSFLNDKFVTPDTETCSTDLIIESIQIECLLSQYIVRFKKINDRLQNLHSVVLAHDTPYSSIMGLSKQAQDALDKHKPCSLWEARKIANVRASDLEALYFYIRSTKSQNNVT